MPFSSLSSLKSDETLVFKATEATKEMIAWNSEAFRLSSSLEKYLKREMMLFFFLAPDTLP